jgi:hypothetical protein
MGSEFMLPYQIGAGGLFISHLCFYLQISVDFVGDFQFRGFAFLEAVLIGDENTGRHIFPERQGAFGEGIFSRINI